MAHTANGEKIRLDSDLKGASGVALSPDGLWLFVAQGLSRTGLSYRVRSDGTVDAREAFYDFYVPALGRRQRCGRDCHGSRRTGLCCHADGSPGLRSQRTCGGEFFLCPVTPRVPASVSAAMISIRSMWRVAGRCIAESFMCRARLHGRFRLSFRPGELGSANTLSAATKGMMETESP